MCNVVVGILWDGIGIVGDGNGDGNKQCGMGWGGNELCGNRVGWGRCLRGWVGTGTKSDTRGKL